MTTISIISPFLNSKDMLKRTLESVLRQDYPNIEHVIADGGSTDGSVEILKEYEKKYEEAGKKLVWISEKDRGTSEAINKAAGMSHGTLMISMQDVFTSDYIVSKIVKTFENNDVDYSFGGLLFHKEGRVIRRWSGKPGNWHLGFMMATPTLCYTREVWKKHGPYSEEYVSANDYDFQIKLFKDKSLKFISIPEPLVIFYAGGMSNGDFSKKWFSFNEGYKVLRHNQVPFAAFTNLFKTAIAMCAYIFASHRQIELEDWMI